MIFKWQNLEKKFEKKLDITSKEIIKLPDGDILSKLIIGISLKYDTNKKNKIKLSKLYQVLCDETTLYAEIEGDKSAQNKINTFIKEFFLPKINERNDDLCYLRRNNNFNDRIDCFMCCNNKNFNRVCYDYALRDNLYDYNIELKKEGNKSKIIFLIIFMLIIIFGYYLFRKFIK